MESLPKRKMIRLSEYDYSRNGCYFVTVCIRDKRPILWDTTSVGEADTYPQTNNETGDCNETPVGADIIRPQNDTTRPQTEQQTGMKHPCVRLSVYGEIVDRAIQNIPMVYPEISVDTYVIMPDHVHMILVISGSMLTEGSISSPNLMCVVGQMKRWVSKNLGMPIWQKSFFEHIIRNYDDYINTVKYIMYNPQKLMLDP